MAQPSPAPRPDASTSPEVAPQAPTDATDTDQTLWEALVADLPEGLVSFVFALLLVYLVTRMAGKCERRAWLSLRAAGDLRGRSRSRHRAAALAIFHLR